MLKGLGGLGDMAKMMKAAQEMQARMAALTEELERMTVTGEAGTGLVRVTCTAKGEVTGLSIDPSILQASEREVVEDLILAGRKDAQRRAAEKMRDEPARMMQDMGLPAEMKLPFGGQTRPQMTNT